MKYLTPIVLMCALFFYAPLLLAQETELPTDMGMQTGTVTETIEVDGYIYLRLDEPDMWLAVPTQAVYAGDRIKFDGGMEMRDFYSRALDRTFDVVFFVQNVSVVSKDAQAMHRMAQKHGEAEKREIPKPVSVAAPAPGEIARLAGGKTIVEILAAPDQLDKQQVSLRAKVLKISENINGKNWVTLSDGTGSGPDNRLLATSAELVSLGDLVIATGIVGADIDIGSGYRYKVLLEQATFSPGTE